MAEARGSWFEDFRWAMNAMRARRWRRQIGFAARIRFDNALRPKIKGEPGVVIDYPDALYNIKVEDVIRAMWASGLP